MAIIPTPQSSKGILDAVKGALNLFSDTNKTQGVLEQDKAQPIDEYESKLSEQKIIELTSIWKRTYAAYYDPIDKSQQMAFAYWVGRQRTEEAQNSNTTLATKDVIDNLIFESIETFLPIATRANPDPLVSADPSDVGQQIAKNIKVALVHWADTHKLRRKLARMVRQWVLARIGVVKISWNTLTKEIDIDVINPRRMIFDKDGYIDEAGHFVGEYLGEKKQATVEKLIDLFPKKEAEIIKKGGGKMGTKLEYYEWWYGGTDLFFTLDEIVLGKFKNPNWNYDIEGKEAVQEVVDQETGEVQVPGEPEQPAVQGKNHEKQKEAPYVFFSVFSTGLHPHDDTSLVLQNITIQDAINRRYRQLDKNIQGMNEGLAVSSVFTEEQAAQAAASWRRGIAIRVPSGDVTKAVTRLPAPPLPSDVGENLKDLRGELRGIFGTSGSTPQAVQKEDTVRGKILVNQQDSSRIGGGITEQIEQVADSIYNKVVQFMFVYYDEEHFVTSAGATGGVELITLKNQMFPLLKSLDITVKEGSLIPKDPITQRNEAIDLWSAQAIDPFNFFKRLDFPDPAQATQQLMLWQLFQKGMIAPNQYLPSFQIPPNNAAPPGQPLPPTSPVNNLDASPAAPPITPPTSNDAVKQQDKQLIQSVPVPKVA